MFHFQFRFSFMSTRPIIDGGLNEMIHNIIFQLSYDLGILDINIYISELVFSLLPGSCTAREQRVVHHQRILTAVYLNMWKNFKTGNYNQLNFH